MVGEAIIRIFGICLPQKTQEKNLSYVDAFYDREDDIIRVVERNEKGERHYKDYPAKHLFYYPDPKGKFTSIFGQPLTRVSSKNVKEHRKELAIY